MAHEITATDALVLNAKPAWHGLGVVVEQAPTPQEALTIARLDWLVEQWNLRASSQAGEIDVSSHVLNVRSDTNQPLGVVGKNYKPVQNHELADFVSALGETKQVKLESAGSIRGGRRVWFLARGESIWVTNNDEVKPYLLVANAHDGTLGVSCRPTTIRVVCKNTLHASLNQRGVTSVHFRHEGSIQDKLDDAKRALGIYAKATSEFADQARTLNAKDMSREDLHRFWIEVYAATVNPIPLHPANAKERELVENAKRALSEWGRNFDEDRRRTHQPASRWAAVNAATQWFDHQRSTRARTHVHRTENRLLSNWWGPSAEAKARIFSMALSR